MLDDLPTVLSSLAAVDPPVITALAVALAAAAAASATLVECLSDAPLGCLTILTGGCMLYLSTLRVLSNTNWFSCRPATRPRAMAACAPNMFGTGLYRRLLFRGCVVLNKSSVALARLPNTLNEVLTAAAPAPAPAPA